MKIIALPFIYVPNEECGIFVALVQPIMQFVLLFCGYSSVALFLDS